MRDAKVWLRKGDAGEYESFDSAYEAGFDLGQHLAESGVDLRALHPVTYRPCGIQIRGIFWGNNYVSLFWGDEAAQPVNDSELTPAEKLDFEWGLDEGFDA